MPADEKDSFDEDALEAAIGAAEAEGQETREVHPDSPELISPESLAAEEVAEEIVEVAEEVPAEPVAEAPAAPEPWQPPQQQQVPPGYVPVATLDARLARERQHTQAALSRVEELSAGFDEIKQRYAAEDAAKAAAADASSVPTWEDDPLGHLRTTVTREVLAGLQPTLAPMQETLGKLNGLVGQTEEQMKAREMDQTLRQAYTMQDRSAMAADPAANAAINHFHHGRFQHHLSQGNDVSAAGHLANEDRFNLYRTTGTQDGPAALVTAYRNLGIDPLTAWQQVQRAAQPAPPAQEVPQQTAQVPQQVPQYQSPAGPRRLEEVPPPTRRRRPSESESTAFNYIMHHYGEIPENELDQHIQKYSKEEGIPLPRAYDNVLQSLKTRTRTA